MCEYGELQFFIFEKSDNERMEKASPGKWKIKLIKRVMVMMMMTGLLEL